MRIFLVFICFSPALLFCQTSAYQSSDGNTSIFLDDAKANLIFNVSDTKFNIGYLHEGSGRSLLYGFDFTGKSSTDFTSIFQKGQVPASVGGSVSIGIHHFISKDLEDQNPKATSGLRDDWALLQLTYARSSFQTATNASVTPTKRDFDSFRVLVVENALLNTKPASLLIGVAGGAARSNNTDSLQSVTINTVLLQSGAGIPPFTVTKSSSGFLGNYKEFVGAPVFTDAVFIPKKLKIINIDAFTRSDVAYTNRYVSGGVGLFLAQSDNVTKVLGGISVAWKNGTPSVGLVAGFAF